MATSFADLSREGKLAKIEQHIGGGHPVPEHWVRWVVDEFVPADHWPTSPDRFDQAFAELDDAKKLEKLAWSLGDGLLPSSWVSWLLRSYVDGYDCDEAMARLAAEAVNMPR